MRDLSTLSTLVTHGSPIGSPLVRLALGLYDAAIEAAVWALLAPLGALHAALGPATRDELLERLGSVPGRDWEVEREGVDGVGAGRVVWIHAVSVGELAAAEALLIDGAGPGGWLGTPGSVRVVLSTGTREGLGFARLLRERHASVSAVRLLPWDRRRVLRRLLGAVRPDVLVVVETELWPGLLAVCAELAVPVELVSVRIPPPEVWRYRLGRWFFGPLLETVAGIGAQSEAERERLLCIGAPPGRISVTGNLKADRLAASPAAVEEAAAPANRVAVVLGASTHRADERVLFSAASELLARGLDLRLVIAPRHPSRARSVARRARDLGPVEVGIEPSRSSARTVVVDRLGVLDSLYDRSDVVVVGGAFGNRGGHDPLAPASRGRPVLIGPRPRHVEHSVESLCSAGGAWIVEDAVALAERLAELLADPQARRLAGRRAVEAVARERGAARRSGARVARWLQVAAEASSGRSAE